jgi:predicted nucleotide-binding protein
MTRKSQSIQITPAQVVPSVPPETGIVLLEKLIEKATSLKSERNLQSSDEQAWVNLARDYLIRVFGSDSPNINSVIHAGGNGGLYAGMSEDEYCDYLRSSFENKIKLLRSCVEQLQTDIELSQLTVSPDEDTNVKPQHIPSSDKVFVVHGHNNGMKETVARFLERLELEPIILHEKANAGRTIIEKFSDYSDVQFAVVLLTADDEGKARASTGELALRARQNVILELGYFLGKLGRTRVCALYEVGVEIPSDYQGVLFVELDSSSDRWRYELVRELRIAGFDVDANRIFSD